MLKYKEAILKYLVEIIVIVFGILEAFALDRWNENRNNKTLEHDVLRQIKEDLTVTLQDMKNDFIVHDIALTSHIRLDSFIKHKLPFSDSLVFDYYWIKEDEYIFPNMTGFKMLESSGTNLVTNDTLRTMVSYVFNHDYPRITKGINLHPDIKNYLTPYYQKHFKPNDNPNLKYTLTLENNYVLTYPRDIPLKGKKFVEHIGLVPNDYKKVMSDPEFMYLISEAKKFRLYKYWMYSNTITRVEALIKAIDLNIK